MNIIAEENLKLAKYSLSFLWVFTGITSAFFAPAIGYDILLQSSITGRLADVCVMGGSLMDVGIGAWILTGYQQKKCCLIQIIIVLIFSVLLSVIAPQYWLHPFGPITKNIPILALILILYRVYK